MQSSIVCGVDGSVGARAALAVAAELAERLRARLVLAYVADQLPSSTAAGPLAAMSRPALMTLTKEMNEVGARLVAEMARAAGVDDVEQRVLSGMAAERLADLADEEAADMIVVGSRGRGSFKATFLGSVSSDLIGVARCPVLVVPKGVRGS
jgi:nucleotide-binding universal stress UspA family protein